MWAEILHAVFQAILLHTETPTVPRQHSWTPCASSDPFLCLFPSAVLLDRICRGTRLGNSARAPERAAVLQRGRGGSRRDCSSTHKNRVRIEISRNLLPLPRLACPSVLTAPFITSNHVKYEHIKRSRLLFGVGSCEELSCSVSCRRGREFRAHYFSKAGTFGCLLVCLPAPSAIEHSRGDRRVQEARPCKGVYNQENHLISEPEISARVNFDQGKLVPGGNPALVHYSGPFRWETGMEET
ncbi:uncharacterized protein ACIBXB_011980 [Morphnus guianensis]